MLTLNETSVRLGRKAVFWIRQAKIHIHIVGDVKAAWQCLWSAAFYWQARRQTQRIIADAVAAEEMTFHLEWP